MWKINLSKIYLIAMATVKLSNGNKDKTVVKV